MPSAKRSVKPAVKDQQYVLLAFVIREPDFSTVESDQREIRRWRIESDL
jgi:hypothetical protein